MTWESCTLRLSFLIPKVKTTQKEPYLTLLPSWCRINVCGFVLKPNQNKCHISIYYLLVTPYSPSRIQLFQDKANEQQRNILFLPINVSFFMYNAYSRLYKKENKYFQAKERFHIENLNDLKDEICSPICPLISD